MNEGRETDILWVDSELTKMTRLLAAPPDEQQAWLRSIHPPNYTQIGVDPLAIDFEDLYVLVDQLVDTGVIKTGAHVALQHLHEALTRLSAANDPTLWGLSALGDRQEWQEIRGLARNAIAQLDSGM